MSGLGQGGRFTGTTSGHIHSETPKVFLGASPPTEGMKRGDIWVQTLPISRMRDGGEE